MYTMLTTGTAGLLLTMLTLEETMPSHDNQRIRVSQETWRRLNARKQPGDTFDDVVSRLLSDGSSDAN
jgi:hypothetical protein